MKRRVGSFDQLTDFLLTQNVGQCSPAFGVGSQLQIPGPLESSGIEETECSKTLTNGIVSEFAISEQIGGVLTDVLRSELVGRTFEIAGEILDVTKVRLPGSLRVITTHEFFER